VGEGTEEERCAYPPFFFVFRLEVESEYENDELGWEHLQQSTRPSVDLT